MEEAKSYPKAQFTFVKGDINVTFRGEDWNDVWKDFQLAVNAVQDWVGFAGTPQSQKATASVNGEATKACPTCGSEMIFKAGTSKTGKPYQGMFCQNKSCKKVEWLS